MTDEPPDVPAGHVCVLPFDTDAHDFARGFEAGRIWQQLVDRDDAVEETIHARNAEMVLRMAEATGRSVVGEDLDDIWTLMRFSAPGLVETRVSGCPEPDTS